MLDSFQVMRVTQHGTVHACKWNKHKQIAGFADIKQKQINK